MVPNIFWHGSIYAGLCVTTPCKQTTTFIHLGRTMETSSSDTINNNHDTIATSIEIGTLDRCRLEEITKSLESKLLLVKCLHMKQELFRCRGFNSPTRRNLKELIECVGRMEYLEELCLVGKLYIDNVHDVQVIANSIGMHRSLRRFELKDFIVYARDGNTDIPVLDPLLTAASTIQNLESLQLKCWDCFRRWKGGYFTTNSLMMLCRSTRLEQLTLSGVALDDEHFETIAREVGRNQNTRLKELILNDNDNGDAGLCAIATLLERNSTIVTLEAHNMYRPQSSTCELIVRALEKNCIVKQFRINAPHSFSKEIRFFLQLNRAGRQCFLNPQLPPERTIQILAAANADVSLLMRLLQHNPSICQRPAMPASAAVATQQS